MVSVVVNKVCRSFGFVAALRNISMTFHSGAQALLIGENGAGKTTLLRCIAGLCSIERGSIVFESDNTNRQVSIGYVGSTSQLYEMLTVGENFELFSKIQRLDSDCDECVDIFKRFELERYAGKLVKHCSHGIMRRVSLACSLIGDPALLLLDEPFAHLDEKSRETLKAILKSKHEEGKTIVYSSNDPMVIAEHVGDVFVLNRGSVVSCNC